MTILSGAFRLGRDVELRYLPDGSPVCNLLLAYNYGRKGDNGKRPTQWVDAGLFGERAEKLAQYLKKGVALDLVLEGVHIETYQKTGSGEGFKLVGRVALIDFVSGASGAREAGQDRAKPTPAAPPESGVTDFEDDLPF